MRRNVRLPRRTHGANASASRDRWLISYADFMTLLFAFFTTMYAVSTVDAGKLSGVAAGLHSAFDSSDSSGLVPGGSILSVPSVMTAGRGFVGAGGSGAARATGVLDVRAELERALGDDLSAHRVQLTEDRRGIVLSIPEAGAFPPGSAEMSIAARQVMTRLSNALQRLPNAVRIEGHTDDKPIHNARFTSNWELSTARSTEVVQLLTQQGGLAPDRLSAAGYGAFHPITANASAEGRARNRRVDVIVLNMATRAAEEPGAPGPR